MRLSHVNITMPPGNEPRARAFYGDLLGLREIPKPAELLKRGGVWFDAGGLDLHVSVEDDRAAAAVDHRRHFGLECADVDAMRDRMIAAGVEIDAGRPAPWRRFFVRDPFGNRIEIHEPGALRGG
ncbi:MAG TPA: VOC family protein [Tepidisphaeraceae bacterium]|nr:VOC family protein [Tepidisphaeraceae bacterium]